MLDNVNLIKARQKYKRLNETGLAIAKSALPAALEECPDQFDLVYPTPAIINRAFEWQLPWEDYLESWIAETRRFGCAVFHKEILCGLGLGKFSKNGKSLNILMLEGNAGVDHPFKGYILETVELVALATAIENKAVDLRLIAPLRGVVAHYVSKGYTLVTGNPSYCMKKV